MPKIKDFKGYRNPWGSKDPDNETKNNSPETVAAKPEFKGYRRPGLGKIEYAPQEDSLPAIEKPKVNPTDSFKGYRSPSMEQPEEAGPKYSEVPSNSEDDFVQWFGENMYKGTKEEAKKKALDVKKAEIKAKEPPKEPDEIDKALAAWKNTGEGAMSDEDIKQQKKEKYGDDFGSWSDAWEGAKASITDIPEAAKQIWHAVKGNKKDLQESMDRTAENAKKYNSTAGKLGYFTGSMAPILAMELLPTGATQVAGAGRMAQLVKMLSGPVAKGVLGGALSGALTPEEGGSAEDFASKKILQTGIGGTVGLGGGLISKAIGAIARPTAGRVGQQMTMKEIGEGAEKLGIKLTPGQVSGSKILKGAEEGLANLPGSASVFEKNFKDNQKTLNRLAVESIDKKSSAIAPDINFLTKAKDQANEIYGEVRKIKNIDLGDAFFKEAKKHLKEVSDVAGKKGVASNEISSIIKGLEKGKVSGDKFLNTSIKLGDMAKEATGGEQRALLKMRGLLDDAAEGAGVESIKNSRKALAKIHRVERAIENPDVGDININKIFKEDTRTGLQKGGMADDLNLAGSIYNITKPEKMVQGSQTAARQQMQKLAQVMTNPAAAAGTGLVAGGPSGLMAALVGMGGANLGSKALLSKAVMKNMLKGSPKLLKNMKMINKGIMGATLAGPRQANR